MAWYHVKVKGRETLKTDLKNKGISISEHGIRKAAKK